MDLETHKQKGFLPKKNHLRLTSFNPHLVTKEVKNVKAIQVILNVLEIIKLFIYAIDNISKVGFESLLLIWNEIKYVLKKTLVSNE